MEETFCHNLTKLKLAAVKISGELLHGSSCVATFWTNMVVKGSISTIMLDFRGSKGPLAFQPSATYFKITFCLGLYLCFPPPQLIEMLLESKTE